MANPFVFIVGSPRSGTTLLRRLVNAHSQIAIVRESPWITDFFEQRKGLTTEGLVTPELISHLLNEPRFIRLGIGREELEALLRTSQPVSYPDFVTSIFDLYGQRQGKALVGDKKPSYTRRLYTLHALWPTLRFVHLIRDGRDVCLSMMNWRQANHFKPRTFATWEDDPVSTAALWWEAHVRLGRQAGNWLGPELYYELRYESLVRNPAGECAALCAFLGVPYDDAMLRFHEGRTKTGPALDTKRAWLPITPGLRNWRSEMPGPDVERFEAAAGELLAELGYPRAVARPRPEALEQASQIRNSLLQDSTWIEAMPPAQTETAVLDSRSHGSWAEGHHARASVEGGEV